MKKILLASSLLLSLAACNHKLPPSDSTNFINAARSCSTYFHRLENKQVKDNEALDNDCLDLIFKYKKEGYYSQAQMNNMIDKGNTSIWLYFAAKLLIQIQE